MNDEQEDGRSLRRNHCQHLGHRAIKEAPARRGKGEDTYRTSALVLYIVRRAKKPLRPLNNAIGLVGVQGGDVK